MSSQFSSQITGDGNDGKPYNIPVQPTSHFMLKNQKTSSIIVTRSQGKFTPKNQGVFRTGDIMRIEIPSTQWLDTEAFAISFTLEIQTAANATVPTYLPMPHLANSLHYVRVKNSVQTIFQRVKLMAGSSIPLEDIQEYHILNLMMLYCSAPTTWVENIGFQYEGCTSGWNFVQQLHQNNWNSNNHEYYIRPNLGLFRTGKYLPMGYLGLITFEFYFNPPNVALKASARGKWMVKSIPGTNDFPGAYYWDRNNPYDETRSNACHYYGATYSITNVFAHCVWLNPREELNNQIQEKMKSGSEINLYFDTFRNSQRQISNAWAGEQTILIQERVASLKGVLLAMVNQGDDRSYTREIRFNPNNMTRYRWRIGDTFYPQTEVLCDQGGVEARVELNRFWGQDMNIECDNLIRYENYRPDDLNQISNTALWRKRCPTRGVGHSDRFIVGFNCENSLGQLSGIDTLRMNSDIEFRYTLGNTTEPINTNRNWIAVQPELATFPCPAVAQYADAVTALQNTTLDTNTRFAFSYFANSITKDNISDNMDTPADSTFHYSQWEASVNEDVSVPVSSHWLNQPPIGPEGYSGLQTIWPQTAQTDGNFTVDLSGNNWTGTVCYGPRAANTGAKLSAVVEAAYSAKIWMASLYTPCPSPTYYTWQIFTHFDAVLQIKTFGTVAATTDIFQL